MSIIKVFPDNSEATGLDDMKRLQALFAAFVYLDQDSCSKLRSSSFSLMLTWRRANRFTEAIAAIRVFLFTIQCFLGALATVLSDESFDSVSLSYFPRILGLPNTCDEKDVCHLCIWNSLRQTFRQDSFSSMVIGIVIILLMSVKYSVT
jgi:hypothetical protein